MTPLNVPSSMDYGWRGGWAGNRIERRLGAIYNARSRHHTGASLFRYRLFLVDSCPSARRLANASVPMDIQPPVAVSLSRFGDLRHWASIDGISVARTATGGRNQLRYPYAAVCGGWQSTSGSSRSCSGSSPRSMGAGGDCAIQPMVRSVLALFTVESSLIAGSMLLLIGLSIMVGIPLVNCGSPDV
jgi:hypothetical protein